MTDRTGILPKQPLFYVLTSLRFQRWLSMPAKIPDIQDALRERFPLFNQIYYGSASHESSSSMPQGEPAAWAFHTADRKLGCQITPEQIVVHAVQYTRFEEFAEVFRFVLGAVQTQVKAFDVGAIGIRYLDRIAPRAGETLADYLPAEFLPKTFPGSSLVVESGLSQTTYRTATGVLQARFWSGRQYLSVPDDLVPLYVLTQDIGPSGPNLQPLEYGQGILDSDSIWTSPSPIRIQVDEAVEKLRLLHEHSNDFFRTVCAEAAFRAWRGES